MLTKITVGAYELAAFDRTDIASAEQVLRELEDHDDGLAEASIVVLSYRFGGELLLRAPALRRRTELSPAHLDVAARHLDQMGGPR